MTSSAGTLTGEDRVFVRLPATTHAAAAIVQEMRKPVHESWLLGVCATSEIQTGAGGRSETQTSAVNPPITAASSSAARRGTTPNRTPSPAAMCAAPVRYAQ